MFNHKRVIMVLPERLGDTLLATPAIHYLKHYCPDMIIDAITLSELSADTIKNNPDIHQFFVLPSQKFLKKQIAHYDYGINIHDGKLARQYFNMLKIPVFHPKPPHPATHHAEQALQFAQNLLPNRPPIIDRGYRLYAEPKDFDFVEKLLKTEDELYTKHILIGCQMGCHSVAKRSYKIWRKPSHPKVWPIDHIVELAKKLYAKNQRIRLVITGSKSEKSLGKQLQREIPHVINLIDKTTVPQLKALMAYLKMFISPDTGLLHIACSSDIPLVALFGPTNISRTAPYPELTNLTLIQAPSMAEISPDEVFRAVLKNLNKS